MHDDPEVIRKEIEETRERIAGTAEALAYKTDVPARMKDTVADRIDAVKSAVSDVASNVANTLSGATHAAADTTQSLKGGVYDVSANARGNLSSASAKFDDVRGNVAGSVADATASFKENFAGTTANVQSNVADLGDRAQGALANSGDATKTFALNTKGLLEKNPLGLAIGAVAVGFLAGLALPVSDIERDNVGPIGDRVGAQAKSAAEDLVAQGKTVVATAVSNALKEAPKDDTSSKATLKPAPAVDPKNKSM